MQLEAAKSNKEKFDCVFDLDYTAFWFVDPLSAGFLFLSQRINEQRLFSKKLANVNPYILNPWPGGQNFRTPDTNDEQTVKKDMSSSLGWVSSNELVST